MEEYLLEGVALSYAAKEGTEVGVDGLWDVEDDNEAAFKTRAYVVRPADSANFNGIVLVNWQNVTIGADFGMPDLEQLKSGYAWVGITTQRVAHEGQPSLGEGLPATIACASGTRSDTAPWSIRVTRSPMTSLARAPERCAEARWSVSTCSGGSTRG